MTTRPMRPGWAARKTYSVRLLLHYELVVHVFADDEKPCWSINSGDENEADTEPAAQLAAEQALEKILTDALEELRGGK